MNKKLKYSAGIFILIIAIITLAFHYSPHVIDAITRETASEYGIRISVWRILFEPVLGVMLFLNRSLFPVVEVEYFLLWILIIMVIYSIYSIVVVKEEKGRLIISQIVNLPIILGLMFTFFVLLLFIPLPNNTIVNHTPNAILVTTHSHTQFSHDGLISQKGLWKWHKRNGFAAFFITDHNNHDHTLDFVHAQREGAFPLEPLVMCGEEFSGSNHLSLLGLKRKFSTHGFSDATAIDSARANHGAVIANHWFDGEKNSLEFYRNLGVDGFEIENTALERTYERKIYKKIKAFCESNHLIMNGGLDFHGYGNACSLWNAFEIPGWHQMNPQTKEAAIIKILTDRDQSKLRVLLYKDRPYYKAEHLFFRPFLTVFNYFRTLNFYQVLSWTIWILIGTFLMLRFYFNTKLMEKFAPLKIIPFKGIVSGLFLLTLGTFYFFKSKEVAGTDNDIYVEYSALLYYIGAALLIYSAVVAYFRMVRK
jgi:hypothetical protein